MMVYVLLKFWCCIFTVFFVFFGGIVGQQTNHRSVPNFVNPNLAAQKGLFANFQSNGIKGHVILTRQSNSSNTVADVFLSGGSSGDVFHWKIFSLSHELDSAESCLMFTNANQLHQIDLTSIFGPIPAGQQKKLVANNIQMVEGESSVLGATLFLRGSESGKVACATLLPTGNKTIYEAKFHYPVYGKATLIQSENTTSMTSHLAFSNGLRMAKSYKWALIGGSERDSSYEAQFHHETTICNELRGHLLLINMPEPDPVNVGLDPLTMSGRSFAVLNNLVDLDSVPIIYMIIYSEPNELIACAPLHRVNRKVGSARFNTPAVGGVVTFTQESPFEPTQVGIDLQLIQPAYSYGIDELPKIIRSKEEKAKACPNIRSIIFNPKNVDPDLVPQNAGGSSDLYAIGDLSGKYGHLEGKSEEVLDVVDYNLPLFGRNSVIGRALVIYDAEGPAIACSNIELVESNMTTAFATFDTPIQGQFIFRQEYLNCYDDTYVYLEISKPNDDISEKTINHEWQIHQNQINPGSLHWSTVNCSTAGNHFNPYNTNSKDCIYFRDCGPNNPLRCQLGDVTSKLGTIDIPPYRVTDEGDLDIGKQFFVDTFLPLCGPASIINKSLIIHGAHFNSSSTISCANVIEYRPRSRTRN